MRMAFPELYGKRRAAFVQRSALMLFMCTEDAVRTWKGACSSILRFYGNILLSGSASH